MKNKKGFTLVELLAVIVILAIILVIAVPQIMNTIDSARKSSLLSSARMIASSAETEYSVKQTLGEATSSITCATLVPDLNTTDYDTSSAAGMCTVSFDGSGNATVNLSGKAGGKFEKYKACGVTASNDVTVTEIAANAVVASTASDSTRNCSNY